MYLDELNAMTAVAATDAVLLHVYFKQLGVVEYVRDELYSVVDFIGKLTVYFITLTSQLNNMMLKV